jgi:hypothetical protein
LRGDERDALVRAQLSPLAPGERPLAITVAAIAAALIGLANLLLWAAGYEVRGEDQSAAGVLVFSALMLVAAVAMWQLRYWAVLGFQALLGITIVTALLSLLLVGNLQGALVALAILVPACALFWSLIRPMARLRMPARPGERSPPSPCPRTPTTASSSVPDPAATWRRSAPRSSG